MATPKTVTVSELRQNLAQFLEELEAGPLMVIQRSRPAGYLVGVETYEEMAKRVGQMEEIMEGIKAMQERMEDPDETLDAEEMLEKFGF